jgi:MFS family permease
VTQGGGRPHRWLTTFFAHTVLVQAVTFVLRPTATYRALELDVSAEWLGILGAGFAVFPLLVAIPSGRAVDRLGERSVMVAGGVLVVLSGLVFTFAAGSVSGLVVAVMVLGLGHLGSVVAQQALVANRTPSGRYDTAFGRYTFATSAGQAVGPGLILLFGGRETIPDTDAIFAWSLLPAAAILVLALLLPASARRGSHDPETAGGVRELLRRPGMLRALTVSCVVLAAVDISLVYIPALGAEQGIASGTIGLLLALRAGASMVSRLFLGRIVAAAGRRTTLVSSIAVSAVAMLVVPLPQPTWQLGLAVALLGLGLGAGQPLTMSWLAEATPPGLRGRAMSLRLTGNRVGQVVLPSAAGFLAVGAGAGGVLAITSAGLAAVSLAARSIPQPRGD